MTARNSLVLTLGVASGNPVLPLVVTGPPHRLKTPSAPMALSAAALPFYTEFLALSVSFLSTFS